MLKTALAVSCHLGLALSYRGKTYTDCLVTGSALGRANHTYSIQCSDNTEKNRQNWQLEYVESGSSAEILDLISRKPIAKCSIEPEAVSKLIKAYETQKHDMENPKCFLSHWHGQVTFHSGETIGRCSFRMNKDLSESFEKATKISPTYQCEHDYFLSGPDKDGTTIFKKTKDGWELDCKAAMQKDEPENIDWKNPPAYYEPEAPTVTPK